MSDHDSASARFQSDLNLLFGVLALQLDFISRDALVCAMNAWVLNKEQPLGDILVSQGALSKERRGLLETLVAEHLRTHENAPERSLAAIPAAGEAREILQPVPDADVHGSLARLSGEARPPGDWHQFATQTFQLGTPSVSRFIIVRPHAKGGLGEVFVALDNELHREVALKQIQDRAADDQESRLRFIAEAEITGSLEHPSIVPVYGLGEYPDGRPFYAMRFIRGESLKDAVDRFHKREPKGWSAGQRGLELRQLLRRFIDICNAIEYSHSRGVIHRDLKPSNVMLGKYGETFVVDWGLAKPVERTDAAPTDEAPFNLSATAHATATQVGMQIGTPQFMSPEQAAGQSHRINFSSDVYCLGATLYYLLTGAAPVSEKDLLVIFKKVQTGDFPTPRERDRHVPAPLDAICRKAMSVDPGQRHLSARALANEVECWLADEPVSSYRETVLERAARWTRRHRAWTQAAMASAVLVAVVATIASLLIHRARQNELVALQTAQEERAAAEASFQHARKTVDDFFTRVSETKLLNVPGVQPLRRELLQDALQYYQDFVKQRGSDPKLRAELAATHFRIGLITNEIGAKSEAIRSLNTALTAQRDLLAQSPGDNALRAAVGNTLNALGDTLLGMRDYADALQYFRQAKEQREQAARENENDPQLRRKVLNSYDNIAIVQALLGSRREAVLSYEQANLARSRLMVDYPEDPTFRHDLARGYFNLAQLHAELDDEDQSLHALRQSAEMYRELVDKRPATLDYARELGIVLRLMGDVETKRSNLAEALKAYDQARTLAERLASKNPLVAELKHDLARLYGSLGQWHRLQSDAAASGRWLDQAIALLSAVAADDPAVTQYSLELAGANLQRGQLFQEEGKLAEACTTLAESVRLYEELARQEDSTKSLSLQLLLAKAFTTLGAALGAAERAEEGLGKLQAAIDLLEKLRTQNPGHAEIDVDLADSYARKAELLFALGRYEEASIELRRTIELRSEIGRTATATPDDVIAWGEAAQGLALVLWEHGKAGDAIAAVEEATAIFESAQSRFPQSERLAAAVAEHYLQRIDLERQARRFDQVLLLGEKALKATQEPTLLRELARHLALTVQAAADPEASADVLAKAQQLAVDATQRAITQRPELRMELREDADFQSLKDVPAWQRLLEEMK